MADVTKSKAPGNDNLGQSGTDNFPTYQDEKGLTAADAGAKGSVDSADAGKDNPTAAPAVTFNHGEESPAAKAAREALENDPPSPTPVQMLPENQDETVKPKN